MIKLNKKNMRVHRNYFFHLRTDLYNILLPNQSLEDYQIYSCKHEVINTVNGSTEVMKLVFCIHHACQYKRVHKII